MFFRQIKDPGLAHYSYLIGEGREAAIIDPGMDTDEYLHLLGREQFELKYIFETHRNEDYLLGAPELIKTTGAEFIHADRQWKHRYGRPAEDGQSWQVGNLSLRAMHTPGHTPGSMSYVMTDPDGLDLMAFTGDTLFAGSTGRTDLLGEDTLESATAQLYDSLFNKILKLGDGVLLCPAHGSGSVCGSEGAERDMSSIGIEKENNPHLKYENKNDFIRDLAVLQERPPYFRQMEKLNLERDALQDVASYLKPLTVEKFEKALQNEALLLDIRSPFSFAEAHLPGSLSIWKEGIPKYAGWYFPYNKPILLVTGGKHPDEAMRMLIRLGFLNIGGYLAGGVLEWQKQGRPTDHIDIVTVQQSCEMLDRDGDLAVLDVRSPAELKTDGRIKNATEIHVTRIPEKHDEVPGEKKLLVFCGSGLRAMTAASHLKNKGFKNLVVVSGGISGWKSSKCPVELIE